MPRQVTLLDPASVYADVETRAAQSRGTSADGIYELVSRTIAALPAGGQFLDVGCGTGHLASLVGQHFDRYVGVDVIRYPEYPSDLSFVRVDMDTGRVPLEDGSCDVVASIETIEHVENPRAFFRELVRLVRPGGFVVVTTPNQLSLLNLLCLATKGRHVQFQDIHYPAHLSALLEVDLRRMANESGLDDVEIRYTRAGRMPLTAARYPSLVTRLSPRLFSDNVLLQATKLN